MGKRHTALSRRTVGLQVFRAIAPRNRLESKATPKIGMGELLNQTLPALHSSLKCSMPF
jgi:hypothetical protein